MILRVLHLLRLRLGLFWTENYARISRVYPSEIWMVSWLDIIPEGAFDSESAAVYHVRRYVRRGLRPFDMPRIPTAKGETFQMKQWNK